MAEQSHHDAINQSLSTDVLSSVDASASKDTVFAARAAGDKPSNDAYDSPDTRPDNADTGDAIEAAPTSQDTTQAQSSEDTSATDGSKPTSRIVPSNSQDQETAYEEEAIRSAKGDGSVGSDTDTNKTDAGGTGLKDADARDGGSRFALKKSTSFKPVSVNKSFLAKAGSVSAPTKSTSAGEKSPATPGGSPAPSSLPAPRPRLVAKLVSGQRGSLPKIAPSANAGGQSNGPDPSQVWNKNRVQATPAVPKQLTDEELRQQYGIQLASRPLEDGDTNQAKWADIDDEDDWAPETIEWNDGTKVNLAEKAAAAAAAEEAAIAHAKAAKEKAANSARAADSPAKSTSIGPNATVLKLGGAGQHKSTNSISKPTPEKPSLVSKPFAPSAVKSPWAALPAIDKVSPVQIHPPSLPGQPKFSQRDPHGFDAMPSPPNPHAKEIEADDFSRFSRDSANGVPRELYIPQSGKYEPVRDSRRPSFRNEGNYRQPSVLQRPPHGDREADMPAGPSPAFQTRSQQDPGPWSRRRASSGVSGESGRFGRVNVGRSYDGARVSGEGTGRRDSTFDQSSHRDTSPAQSHGRSMASHSPTTSQAPDGQVAGNAINGEVPAGPQQVTPNAAGEDPVTVQKRLMREKREAAIKRRKEEEEREEVAKRERIRIKMEQLGLSTDGKPEKKDAKSDQSEENREAAIHKLPAKDSNTPQVTSPPKPPAPNPSGEPQQYGLMKVHAPQPTNITASGTSTATASNPLESADSPRDPQHVAHPVASPQPLNGDPSQRSTEELARTRQEPVATESGPGLQSWSQLQPQPPAGNLAGWSASNMGGSATSKGNLWGPPSNHRALGNGDFQHRNSLKPAQPPYAVSTTPQPIGTPRQRASNRNIDPHTASLIDDLQPIPHIASPDPSLHRTTDPRNDGHVAARVTQEHPTLLEHVPTGSNVPPMGPQGQGLAAWATFSANNGRLEAEQVARERAAHLADPNAGKPRTQDQLPVLEETWKQVSRGAEAGQRHVVGSTKVTSNYAPSPAASQPQGEFHYKTSSTAAAPHARSRFQDIFEHQQRGVAPRVSLPRPPSPSIPPPDSTEHPAYVGDNHRPLVKLPGSKPKPVAEKPVVKLPPAKDYTKQARTSPPPAARQQSWSGIVKHSSATQSWQDRINGLWEKKSIPSPPVQTASKPRFDPHPVETTLSISLPPKQEMPDSDAPTRSVDEEEALFEEEREFGSIPTVRIATPGPNHTAWNPVPRADWRERRLRPLRDHEVLSIISFEDDSRGPVTNVSILLSGMKTPITKALARESHQGSRRTNRGRGVRHSFRAGKTREVSHGSAPGSTNGDRTPSKDSAVAAGNAAPKTGASRGSYRGHKPFRGNRNVSSSSTPKN